MTRLHEALERAQALASGQSPGPAGGNTPTVTPPEVQAPWQFDTDTITAPSAETTQAAPEEPAVEAATGSYNFLTDATAAKLIVGPEAGSLLVEQYRRLGAALHHSQAQTNARTVMIASAVESEGKTLTAANVALTLSHSYQRRVLLVDADLRRPAMHDLFRLSNRSGLGDVLDGLVPEAKLPVQQVSPHLWVLTAGRANPDPMSGLVSTTMREFLFDATEQFDWVVLDTPPVGLLTDANLLAAMIDLALLVVRAKSTPYPLVRRAIEAIGQERILGVVLNRADAKESAHGYYYAYSYQYAHSPESVTRRRWFTFSRRHRKPA